MIEAGCFIAGVFVGVIGMYFIARNNRSHIDRVLDADIELKRRVDAAIEAAKK